MRDIPDFASDHSGVADYYGVVRLRQYLCIVVVLMAIATAYLPRVSAQIPLERLRALPIPSIPALRDLPIPPISPGRDLPIPSTQSVEALSGDWLERLRQANPDDPNLNPDQLFPPDAAVQIPGFGPLAGWEPIPFTGALKTDALYDPKTGYGIGTVEFMLPGEKTDISVEEVGLSILEADGRIFYPSLEIRQIPREVTGTLQASGLPIVSMVGSLLDQPPRAFFRFVFVGEKPLTLELRTPEPIFSTVTPRRSAPLFTAAREQWWKAYTRIPSALEQRPDYPPFVENYLKSMLSARFELPFPQEDRLVPAWTEQLSTDLGVMGVTETMRLAYVRGEFTQPRSVDARRVPLESLDSYLPPLPDGYFVAGQKDGENEKNGENSEDIPTIEPLARCVPAECFYVRFGNFGNLVWLQDFLTHWGGDTQNLLVTRAVNPGLQNRFEQRLQQKLDTVSRVVGPSVIEDVGIIGTDTFFQDGAAFGMVFLAKNAFLFETSTNQERKAIADKDPQTVLKNVAFKSPETGKPVLGTLLISSDGKICSYFVRSGKYYCVTSSRRIAERFLAACNGVESLADCADFQETRRQNPADAGDAAFVFMSRAFLRNLASPAYRIELSRRVRAIANQEMFLLANLASETEGIKLPAAVTKKAKDATGKEQTVADPKPLLAVLQKNQFLPKSFDRREDGSRLQLTPDGVILDSRRGLRGAFTPIPDIDIADVSETESKEYQAFAEDFRRQWSKLQPGVVVFRRLPLETAGDYYSERATAEDTDVNAAEIERIVVDSQVSFLSEKYTQPLLMVLGPERTDEVVFDPRERASFDISLPQNHLFGAIREPGGTAKILRDGVIPFRSLPDLVIGWFGYHGEPGLLATIYDHLALAPDADGLRRGLLGLWSGAYETFQLYSFQRELIPDVASRLQFVESSWPAQIRIRVRDPQGDASLTELIQVLSQGRAIRATAGNLRLLNQLSLQFRISPEESLRIAESLLDAKLVDPFGGKYVRSEDGNYWVTTDWTSVLAGKTTDTPLLEWFRGMRLDGSVDERGIVVHLETAMRLPENLRKTSTEDAELTADMETTEAANSPVEIVVEPVEESTEETVVEPVEQTSENAAESMDTESETTEESVVEDLLNE